MNHHIKPKDLSEDSFAFDLQELPDPFLPDERSKTFMHKHRNEKIENSQKLTKTKEFES